MGKSKFQWLAGVGTVFFDDVASAPTLRRGVTEGLIKKVATGIYSSDQSTSDDDLIRLNISAIVGHKFPGATVVDRTAAEHGAVSSDGTFAIAHGDKNKRTKLGEVTIIVRPADSHRTDLPWPHGLAISSQARAIVDNAATFLPGRRRLAILPADKYRTWLEAKRLGLTDTVFNRLRTDAIAYAREVSPDLINQIEALFVDLEERHRTPVDSASPTKQSSNGALGWDRQRVELIHSAAKQLAELNLQNLHAPECLSETELPFYEAYFSNYIEGTEFTVSEARALVKANTPPKGREADGHDVLGTLLCAAGPSRAEIGVTPDEVIALMKMRHKSVMRGRPERSPGEWKEKANRAGSTFFVEPELVEGTLLRAFEPINDLEPGFARAVYAMFVTVEVHPFADGNGRTGRLMMNAELSAAKLRRIVLPTIERISYLQTLKRASLNNGDIEGLVKVLLNSWAWTCSIEWQVASTAAAQVSATNALMSSDDGVSLIIA